MAVMDVVNMRETHIQGTYSVSRGRNMVKQQLFKMGLDICIGTRVLSPISIVQVILDKLP